MKTIKQVAATLNVCEKTVRNEIAHRRLIAFKVGRQWRISDNELAAYAKRESNATQRRTMAGAR